MTITLYDIPYKVPGKAWSPNTFKTRIALNFKGLEFNTEWLEYPDIEAAMKKIGAKPTMKKGDGSGKDHYTLPVIHDSKTGKAVSESFEIALYLDDTYPDKPLLFPSNSRAAIAVWQELFSAKVITNMMPFMLPLTCWSLNPRSQEYFRATREAWYKVKLEEWCPEGPKRDAAWDKIKEGLDVLSGCLDKNPKKPFLFGDTFTYGDVIIAGWLVWVRLRVSSAEWTKLSGWNDGRWNKLVEDTTKYHAM